MIRSIGIISIFLTSILIISSCNVSKNHGRKTASFHIKSNPYENWINKGKAEYAILDSLKKNNICKNRSTCREIYNCDSNLLMLNFSFSDNRMNELESCCLKLAISGHKDVELKLIDYYDRVYENGNPNFKGAAGLPIGYNLSLIHI